MVDPSYTPGSMETKMTDREIVNPIAVKNCSVKYGELEARVTDISFMRLVIAEVRHWPEFAENQAVQIQFTLERQIFTANLTYKARGENWIRFVFEKMVPSAQAHLRSFLSAKKIGESIIEDWRSEEMRHFHGLNESELWFQPNGGVLFTYLDQIDGGGQFIIRVADQKSALQVGRVSRTDYIEMKSFDSEIPLIPLSDRDIYVKLSECRDIVTNFRPNGQMEYNLKQRLLKVISDHLYSTGNRVELSPSRPPKIVTLPAE